jgi:hypothetical protein
MGEVIYSAGPLQTFLWSFVIIAFLSILGIVGIGMAIFRRSEKTILRIAQGGAGLLLCMAGAVFAFIVARSLITGSTTIAVRLNDKQIAHDNCGDNGTCTRYILETQSGSKFYDLEVTQEAYDKAQIESCYSVTYYPSNGLFGKPENVDSYESVSNITLIETVACR